jgi:hypothetical protein
VAVGIVVAARATRGEREPALSRENVS